MIESLAGTWSSTTSPIVKQERITSILRFLLSSMGRIDEQVLNELRIALGRALRLRLEIHSLKLFHCGVRTGSHDRGSAVRAQKLPTPAPSGRKPPNLAKSILTVLASPAGATRTDTAASARTSLGGTRDAQPTRYPTKTGSLQSLRKIQSWGTSWQQ